MPVKIQNSFSPTTEVGAALNNAITSYYNNTPTYGEVQEGRVSANKADAPADLGSRFKDLVSSGGALTQTQIQQALPGIVEAVAKTGDVGKLNDLMAGVIMNSNRAATSVGDNAMMGAKMAYNTTETGFDKNQANELTKVAMQQRGAMDRTQAVINSKPGGAGGAPAKPLPVGALRLQQDALDSLATANSIADDLGNVEATIDSGDLALGPLTNIGSAIRNFTGFSSENSRNYGTFKATLEKLRNDSLRLNKGVQTEGDSQRAWNELLSNINDEALVQQRLAEIKQINERGAELQKVKVGTIRGNYGMDNLDFENYDQGPAILRGEGAAPNANGITIKRVR
jgi:hypothetical protein